MFTCIQKIWAHNASSKELCWRLKILSALYFIGDQTKFPSSSQAKILWKFYFNTL